MRNSRTIDGRMPPRPRPSAGNRDVAGGTIMDERIALLGEIERRVLWLASWTIHHANHLRAADEVKVGGHQASSASLATIMTALYFSALRPQDRVAVKPHAGPAFHAIQYLAGRQSLDKLVGFRAFKGADRKSVV
jgi:pyruvate dehydrogenase E1 component